MTVSATDSAGNSGTTTLDVVFDECGQPRSSSDEASSLVVRLRAKGPVCVGNSMTFAFTVTPTPEAAVNEVGADLDGTSVEVTTTNGGTWYGRITSETAGTFTLRAGASDTAGAVGSTTLEVAFEECAPQSTTIARPTITLNPSIPPITVRPPGSLATTTTTSTPTGSYSGAIPSNQNKVCVENLDATGTGRLYVTTPVALSAMTAKVGTTTRVASKEGPLRWVVLVDRVDVGKTLNLTGTRSVGGGSLNGSIIVPKGCGD